MIKVFSFESKEMPLDTMLETFYLKNSCSDICVIIQCETLFHIIKLQNSYKMFQAFFCFESKEIPLDTEPPETVCQNCFPKMQVFRHSRDYLVDKFIPYNKGFQSFGSKEIPLHTILQENIFETLPPKIRVQIQPWLYSVKTCSIR